MALSIRHRWCIERIKHCFQERDVDDASIHGFIRKSQVLSKFNALFSGEGKNVIFVHYQEHGGLSSVSCYDYVHH